MDKITVYQNSGVTNDYFGRYLIKFGPKAEESQFALKNIPSGQTSISVKSERCFIEIHGWARFFISNGESMDLCVQPEDFLRFTVHRDPGAKKVLLELNISGEKLCFESWSGKIPSHNK